MGKVNMVASVSRSRASCLSDTFWRCGASNARSSDGNAARGRLPTLAGRSINSTFIGPRRHGGIAETLPVVSPMAADTQLALTCRHSLHRQYDAEEGSTVRAMLRWR